MVYLIFPLLGYLVGSISSAVLVCKLLGLPDPRHEGSGNPGATNVLRLGSKPGAALTLAGDVLKGVVPVLAARWLSDDSLVISLAALAAFLGHLFPVFFRFHGGKGVATALGLFAAISPLLALMLVATWLAVALVFRFSSLAALVSAILAPVYAWWIPGQPDYALLALVLALTLFWRHRDNIRRLLNGTESRIGKRT
ncbi:MAG TPA: acyl-phosphate glycerol 3-phosphate acyltransferase [Gammaproteobacteria bacterium]|jgi:glycerol-3-phosphate acyltransferase PlsY|nr:glycerol-3-phosphate 1-O-acyltransferase PlsY [Arenicellales bacterium]MDP6855332.1 glycerol-3-phosphate 1-O-acyltransferase PlsY [Arenicellales bacterium]MDP6948403.1 glycerol-3-phosphate 1-O-acyltransferase PlsY [Arenicellales bacterium]HCY12895.1 acyl-phosphate glycerol 3-phosphate acyltransferase [Gammaproteobacteria bacterium]|tara:strand:- start:1274 stop:1864 length:591 start_codon:yes stop_codon:yes gene_type:complete